MEATLPCPHCATPNSVSARFCQGCGAGFTPPSMPTPLMSGPPMPGPPMSGPSMSGPSMSGPSMSGPSMSGPSMSGPSMSGPPVFAPAAGPYPQGPLPGSLAAGTPPGNPTGSNRTWVLVGACGGALLIILAMVVGVLLGRRGNDVATTASSVTTVTTVPPSTTAAPATTAVSAAPTSAAAPSTTAAPTTLEPTTTTVPTTRPIAPPPTPAGPVGAFAVVVMPSCFESCRVYRRATPWDDLVEVPHGYHIAGDEVRVFCLADGQLFYDTDSQNESTIWYRIGSGFYLPSTNVDLPGNPRLPVC